MDDKTKSAARADIEKRVARFRETQARLQRERDVYYDTMIEKVRATEWNEFVSPHSDRRSAD